LLEVGVDESDSAQTLFEVIGAAVLSDNRVVVAQATPPMIRWYSARGQFERGTGRPGGGPGEFAPQPRIAEFFPIAADSVATWEHSARRLQVFDPQGRFSRSVVIDLPPQLPTGAYPQFVGLLRSDIVTLVIPQREPGLPGEIDRDSVAYLRHSEDGSFIGRIADLPGFTFYTRVRTAPDGSAARVRARPPFSPFPSATTSQDHFYYTSGSSHELLVFDRGGSLRRIVRIRKSGQPVTADMIRQYKTNAMSGAPADPVARREWERLLEDTPFADSLPAFRRVRVDRLGMLWAQNHGLPGDLSTTWSVFASNGQWITDVQFPAEWLILDIGQDYILALVRNDLDVETVRKYALERTEMS
jgi:hypothetical protein